MTKKYILFSLDEDKTGKLASILGNKTCKNILNALAEQELSETDISKKLRVPLNTVGYSVKNLKSVGLIEEKTHYFSLRGKRIPIYRVSNKEILISPKKSFVNQLKSQLSLVGISTIFTGFILWSKQQAIKTTAQSAEAFSNAMDNSEPMLLKMGGEAGEALRAAAPETTEILTRTTQSAFSFGATEWFLIGIWTLIVLALIVTNINSSFHSAKSKRIERR